MRDFKTICVTGLVLALAATAATADNVPDSETGETLTRYGLTALDGGKTTLSSFRGEVVVVNFWASWCPPCRKELPIMDGWHAKWTGRGGRVVAISIDKEIHKARRFAEEANLSMTILHDDPSGLARTLDLPSLPCTFLLDRDGNVVQMIRGSSEEDLEALHKKAESLLVKTKTGGSR